MSTTPETSHQELNCADCGTAVVYVVRPDPPATRCAVCQWLFDTPMDPAEKAELRKGMLERGVIG